MRLPSLRNLQAAQTVRETVQTRGLNLSDNTSDGDLTACHNLSARRFPFLCARNGRTRQDGYEGVTALYGWNRLLAVQGTSLLYDGDVVGTVTEGEKQFCTVNTKIIIWPDKVYLDMNTLDVHPLGAEAEATKAVISVQSTGTATGSEIALTNAPDLTTVFAAGDSITLGGFQTLTGNNGLNVQIKAVEAAKLTFHSTALTAGTEEVTGDNRLTFQRVIPDMDFICESGNRLWGCSNDTRTIYASAMGDPTNFFVYEGLSTDAYAVAVGSEGDFTGCVKLSTAVLFWKERTLHKILGDYPAEYYLYTYDIDGLRAGCERSMQVINDVLFYMGLHGVNTYAGGTPTSISENFGNRDFSDGVAGTDGERYWLSVRDGTTYRLLVYDTEKGLWMEEDSTRVTQTARLGRDVYALTNGGEVWLLDNGEDDANAEWFCVLAPFWETTQGRKRYSKLNLRLELPKRSWAQVEVRCDGGQWMNCGKVVGKDYDTTSIRLAPNRCDKFEVRLSGKGPCAVLSMLREFSVGGDL